MKENVFTIFYYKYVRVEAKRITSRALSLNAGRYSEQNKSEIAYSPVQFPIK